MQIKNRNLAKNRALINRTVLNGLPQSGIENAIHVDSLRQSGLRADYRGEITGILMRRKAGFRKTAVDSKQRIEI